MEANIKTSLPPSLPPSLSTSLSLLNHQTNMAIHKTPACLSLFLFLFFAMASADCKTAKGGPNLPAQIPKPDVHYKDVKIVDKVCARLYVPKSADPGKKLPLVVHYHGGSFTMFSAFLYPHDNYVYALSKKANVAALSVEYRTAPDDPIPVPYDDSWAAIKWIAAHVSGQGPEEWVNKQVDFSRIFLEGDSAGANIAHNMAMRASSEKLEGLQINGIALMHPFFWGSKPVGSEPSDKAGRAVGDGTWLNACASKFGLDDPRVNPLVDPKLSELGAKKVLVAVAGNDTLFRERGLYYYKGLKESGWKGEAELVETPGEGHCFHLTSPNSKNALDLLKRVSSFVNEA